MKNNIIQPNQVTNARYDFSSVQKNLLYHILGELQDRMDKDNIGEIEEIFEIKMNQLDTNRNYTRLLADLDDMTKKTVRYKITRKDGVWNVVTGIISAFEHKEDSEIVKFYIPSRAIPFLCYIGNGFTAFEKTIALSLRSKHSKRMYELCCKWQNKGGFVMTLEEFRELFDVKNKYTKISQLKEKVINHAKNDLLENSNIYFDYSLKKVHSRAYNMIHFSIFNTKKQDDSKKYAGKYYSFVYGWMKRVFPKNAIEMADKINEDINILRDVYERLKKLDDELTTGKKKQIDVIKITKYFLKEDYDITI